MNKTALKTRLTSAAKLCSSLGLLTLSISNSLAATELSYAIVDTNQTQCVDTQSIRDTCPQLGQQSYGQDSQYQGLTPSYTQHEDGTVTDNNTQLMWAQTIDINGDGQINVADKLSFDDAMAYAANLKLGGHSDWRIASIKELYSLIMFDGQDPSGLNGAGTYSVKPFIDHRVFGFNSGDVNAGERLIDAQYVSSTKYVSTTMNGDETIFGVNFIDGRIKGYGATLHGSDKTFYVLAVRGNTDYGINQFVDNNNASISDKATGLTWQQGDSDMAMDWPAALEYCESLSVAGRDDWRLPNVKELQSIVDYSRSPQSTNSAAIDPIFGATLIQNEAGQNDYANYWSSTTHVNLKNAKNASYVAFGRSLGYMNESWIDVHGAGSQRSDPKVGDASQYPTGHGPQGDSIRIDNYVRCVSGGETVLREQPTVIERETKVYTLSAEQTSMDMQQATNKQQAPEQANQQQGKMQKRGQNENQRPKQGANPLSQMDSNNDGKLSRSEVKGPLAQDFDKIDRNNDGFISADELPKPPARP